MRIWVREPDGFPPAALERLRERGEVLLGPDAEAADVDAVFIRLATRIDRDFLARHTDLRWIVTPTTGLNHIDMGACAGRGVTVLSLRGRTEFLDTIRATAEHTLALALALLRGLPDAVEAVRDGAWDRYPHKGREIAGSTVFVWGYGRIGRQVAALYEAFGARVVGNDIVSHKVPADRFVTVAEGLARCDLLSLHLPLDQDTVGIVDAPTLALLRPEAMVVNTARGELVDQGALVSMLLDGRLAGAALDVLHDEPEPLSPEIAEALAALGPRLLVTPHIAGFTRESLDAVETHMVEVFLEDIE